MKVNMGSSEISEMLSIKQAAARIGLSYRQLLEAVNDGLVPHYKLRKSNRLVVVSEVIEKMRQSSKEAQNEIL